MITLVNNPGGLFNCLGKIGAWLEQAGGHAGATVPSLSADIIDQFNGAAGGQPQITAPLPAATSANQNSVMGIGPTLQQMAQQLVIQLVKLDNPQPDTSLATALREVIRQMKAGGQTIKACTVGATPAALGGNHGDSVLVGTTIRGDALHQENLFAEVIEIDCIADSYSGGATAGAERFDVSGKIGQGNALSYDWPAGSGAAGQLTNINGQANRTGGNMLTNSSFETFTVANTPDGWTITAGVPGTDILKSTAGYDGNALALVGGGAVQAIAQPFLTNLAPYATFIGNFWIKASAVPATGVLTIDLVDGTGATIQDALGNPCKLDIPLNGTTTSYAPRGFSFQTPQLLPSGIQLRIRASTAIPTGTTITIDRLAFTPGTLLYSGGPLAAKFSGATPDLLGDAHTLTMTNNRAGAGTANFQTLFERLFGMRGLKLLLPSVPTGETIPASLIG